jgi:membrane protein implicated in regulation of membrane protease activity
VPELGLSGDARFSLALAVGVLLIVLARWASRTRGTRWDSWVALRIGDVLFTEIVGAFLFGYGLGGLVAQPEAVGAIGPPGSFGPPGRFGRLGPGLPVMLGIVAAAVAIFTRVDLGALLLRGSTPGNGLSNYVGRDASVIARIQAGGYGQIEMRDGLGYPTSAVATADTDIAQGTPVRVVGTKGLNLVVAPSDGANPTTAHSILR